MPKPSIHPQEIKIESFQYELSEERIARYPLKERDQSKLLIYNNKEIKEDIYYNLSAHLPEKSLLLFNQAKVVHARLYFKKYTGGKIEIFCLEPDSRYADITSAMMQENEVYWKCMMRGASKWKDDSALELITEIETPLGKHQVTAEARKVKKEGSSFILHFTWKTDLNENMSFSEFLEIAGDIPIPPYLKREAEKSDEETYQTIFAKSEGSVAAPTAALHFTPRILSDLENKNIRLDELTLHVGAGTFMPVKSDQMKDHEMHAEWIEISLSTLKDVVAQLKNKQKIVCIGTTSARTLESTYWIGVQMLRNEWKKDQELAVSQWYPYQKEDEFSPTEALQALIDYLKENGQHQMITRTQIIIAPGYEFKILDGLITNFHQPASTLLLMISALVGEDWKKIYQYALKNDFRFLSYGDGSLLWRD